MLSVFIRLLSPGRSGIAYCSGAMLGLMRVAAPLGVLGYAALALSAFDKGLRRRYASVILPVLTFSAAVSVGLVAARLDSGLAAFCAKFFSGGVDWLAVQLASVWLSTGAMTALLARTARGPFEAQNPSNQLCMLFGGMAMLTLPLCQAAGLLLLYVPPMGATLAFCQTSARAAYRRGS